LNVKLDSPELVQLAQRVRLRFHLTALSRDDMKAYVLHRLEVAGSGGRTIFADDTFPLLYLYTGGVPRLVNTLCETAMMAAFTADRDHVLLEDVQSAIDELRWQEFAARGAAQTQSAAALASTPQVDHSSTGRFNTAASNARRGPELYVGPQDTGKHETLPEVSLAKLVVVAEGRTIGELSLRMGRTIIGRTPDNDLQIESRFVSRHHCQIVTQADGCVVEDLNSTNGIVVKAKRVRRHSLNDGDVITIGKHDLLYVDERIGQRTGTTGGRPALPSGNGGEDADHGKTQVV
jgi:hypothetical protein